MNQFRARLLFLCGLIIIGGVAVVTRLFIVQLLQGPAFAERSKEQSQIRCMLPARRGDICDRNGRVLAANTQQDLSLAIDVFGRKNGKVPRAVKREYPLAASAGPLLGCIGKDGYGLSGVEFAFDKYLRGEDGWTIIQRDGRNNRYRKIGLPNKEPTPGASVWLTIDADVQKIVDDVLRQSIESLHARGGRCIVMDPTNGKILAMVNQPSFDPNFPSASPIELRQNACINAVYEPGSTFKLITASAALQDGIKKETDLIDGNQGRYEICHQVIRDHEPYGELTFAQAFAHSSNVCFAKIATAVGSDRLFRFVVDYGFGAKSGIELPGEECGILHPVQKWSGRSLATVGIGQEVSVTLLQMLSAYATVANGGVLVKPCICEKIVQKDGSVVNQASVKPVRRVVSEETARRMAVLLRGVVDSGTGRLAAIEGVPIAGKTGTAQKLIGGHYSMNKSWASFIGFLPSDKPVLLCGVVIDEPAANMMGGTAAAPAFKRIVTQIISRPGLEFAEKILNKQTIVAQPVMAAKTEKLPQAVAPVADTATDAGAPDGIVPDLCGKDARDAISVASRQGLAPWIIGAGTVRRQSPAAGSRFEPAARCTLVCAFGR